MQLGTNVDEEAPRVSGNELLRPAAASPATKRSAAVVAKKATPGKPSKKAAAKKVAKKAAPVKKAAKKVAKKAAKKASAKKAAKKTPPVGSPRRGHAERAKPKLGLPELPPPPTDPVEVLGLCEPFTATDLRRAWRAFAARHHPDQGGDGATFTRGREAYDELRSRPR